MTDGNNTPSHPIKQDVLCFTTLKMVLLDIKHSFFKNKILTDYKTPVLLHQSAGKIVFLLCLFDDSFSF
jgi:hypothetical protein